MLNDFFELNMELANTQMLGMLPMGVMPASNLQLTANAILETAPPPY